MAFIFFDLTTAFTTAVRKIAWFPHFCFLYFIFISLNTSAQQQHNTAGKVTQVSGRITDAASGAPIAFIHVSFTGSLYSTTSDNNGNYSLSAPGLFNQVSFSLMGYMPEMRNINPGQVNSLAIKLRSGQTQLKEVKITSAKSKRYRNKGNPAVELIQQVIDHKEQNRMQSADYLQYDLYERIGLSIFNLSDKFINGRFFSKYKFMLDSTSKINGQTQTSLPVFFSEKLFQNYYRKTHQKPSKF